MHNGMAMKNLMALVLLAASAVAQIYPPATTPPHYFGWRTGQNGTNSDWCDRDQSSFSGQWLWCTTFQRFNQDRLSVNYNGTQGPDTLTCAADLINQQFTGDFIAAFIVRFSTVSGAAVNNGVCTGHLSVPVPLFLPGMDTLFIDPALPDSVLILPTAEFYQPNAPEYYASFQPMSAWIGYMVCVQAGWINPSTGSIGLSNQECVLVTAN